MIRKTVFWTITFILMLALAYLIIQGRRMEKRQAARPKEVVREYKPTPTKALAPRDLDIFLQTMTLEKESDPSDSSKELRTARHIIRVRNNGKVSYNKIQFLFEYLNQDGEVLETRVCAADRDISPGNILELPDIKIQGLPKDTKHYRAAITCADIGPDSRR